MPQAGVSADAIAGQSVGAFLDALAAKSPAPGGGAAVGLVAATGAALASMVLAYSLGRKSLAEHEALHRRVSAALLRGRAILLELADADAVAYARLNALQRLEAEDPARSALPQAARAAVDVPLAVSATCRDLLEHLWSLAEAGAANPWLVSDLAIAGELLASASEGAWWNVQVNLPVLDEAGVIEAADLEADGDRSSLRARELAEQIAEACSSSGSDTAD